MQFNYLGGQGGPRDTLGQALGQRNAVLEGQLDFTKSAFVTGVQGAGQTMRQAMQNDQQQRESVLRNKTTLQEGALNRASQMETLQAKLASDKTLATEATTQRKVETDAATAQRKIEADAKAAEADKQRIADADQREKERIAAAGGRKIDADAALDRDKLRIKETEDAANRVRTNAQKDKDAATILDADSNLTAAELSFHTAMSATGDAYKFADTGDFEVKTGKKIPDPTGAKNPDGSPVMIDEIAKNADGTVKTERYSPKAREMMTNFDNLRKSVDEEKDPIKRAALIQKLIGSGQLDYNKSRGLVDSGYVAPAASTTPVEVPTL